MTTFKKILAMTIALPLALGSASALPSAATVTEIITVDIMVVKVAVV